LYESKDHYRRLLKRNVKALTKLQERLYASDTYSLLIIFQAMDTGGKDGAIRHVMSGVNPQGCQVYSFGHPSTQELDHDFLWRTTRDLPERGRIGIFNRSYYEEVLIVRVHSEILKAENLPDDILADGSIWDKRYRSIVEHERHLHANGTRIIKFFLHLSREEQRRRLLERVNDPRKNWKASLSDVEERDHWDAYMHAYSQCLSATTSHTSPWYVVPADDKKNARLHVSNIILATLEELKLEYPRVDEAALAEIRARLDGPTEEESGQESLPAARQ
jgi:PPK2 family polyphosphate:nucleotide phosphotransferase